MGFVGTTLKLWMEVPGFPPLWLCGMVAWVMVSTKPNSAKMGSIYIDHEVDSDHHATET